MSALNMHLERGDPGTEWDRFMEGHPSGHIMQSRAWARVQEASGWKPLFLSFADGGGIRAAALILRRRIPGIGLSLLYAPRGPVLDWDHPALAGEVAAALRELGRQERGILLQADPAIPADHHAPHRALVGMGFQREDKQGLFRIGQPVRAMRIPLDRYGGPEGLFASLHHKTRYNIRLATRKGVEVSSRTDEEALHAFYRLLSNAGRAKGFPVRGFAYHEALWRHCIQNGYGEYLFATFGGEVLGALLVLRFGPLAWYMYGAATGRHRNLMASYLLQWTALCRAWDKGCRCYDMRAVYSSNPNPADEEYGVYDFKRKFNAELVTFLGEYDLVLKPWAYAAWRWFERAAQRPAGWLLSLHHKLELARADAEP